MIEPVEVVALTPGLRIFTVAVWLASAVFFEWLAWSHASTGNWFGYAMGAVSLWSAAYWLRYPAVLARADEAGLAFVDMRYGVFFVFGEVRAAWSDVVGVETRERTTRYGTYLLTRVTVRAEGGADTRRFTLTSKARGYVRFLDVLRERTAAVGAAVEQKGLGDDPERASAAMREIAAGRIRTLTAVLLFSILLIGFLYFFRRH